MQDLKPLLRNNDIIIRRNGEQELYIEQFQSFIAKEGYNLLSGVNNDLCDVCGDANWDIMKIYRPISHKECIINKIVPDTHLIWDRQKEIVEELTISEVEGRLDYKIKVIGG